MNGPSATAASWSRAKPIVAMTLAATVLVGLAWLDHAHEADATLDDLAEEAATLSASVAGEIGARAKAGMDRGEWLAPETRLERTGELRVFLREPSSTSLRSTNGATVEAPTLTAAIDAREASRRLSREEAHAVGLPARMAHAGLATIDEGPAKGFGVVVVESAARTRDRDRRGERRLVGSALVAGALALSFAWFALRRQRAELSLSSELALSKLSRERDEKLGRATRVATMGTLATGIAHEISTPLGVIAGRAEQLEERLRDDERGRGYVQAIASQAAHIADVVRRFLHFARGGSPVLHDVDAIALVRAAARHVDHRFERAGVSLKTETPESLPSISGDARLLEHAITNLLLNACAASPSQGTVRLVAHVEDSSLVIDVSDEGEGIAESDIERATEPFFTTKPEGEGTGLGLAITSEIAKAHRGTLTLSRERIGTRARLSFPLASTARA